MYLKIVLLILLVVLIVGLCPFAQVVAQWNNNETVVINNRLYSCFYNKNTIVSSLDTSNLIINCKTQGFRYANYTNENGDTLISDCADIKTYSSIYPDTTILEYNTVYNQCLLQGEISEDYLRLSTTQYPSYLPLKSVIQESIDNNQLLGSQQFKYQTNPNLSRTIATDLLTQSISWLAPIISLLLAALCAVGVLVIKYFYLPNIKR
jgi:hypothetical protein